jgi:hypothetical protein
MENRNVKSIFRKCIVVYFILFSFSVPLQAEEQIHNQHAIETYQENRQAFLIQQKDANRQFKRNESTLKSQLHELETIIQSSRKELSQNNIQINKKKSTAYLIKKIQSGIAYFLFPIATLAFEGSSFFGGFKGGGDGFLSIFLSLAVINLFLYLMIRQKDFFIKYKIVLIVLVVFLVSAIASPLFAEENMTKQQNLVKNLEMVEDVFSQTDDERYIAILESWTSNTPIQIDLSKLVSKDPFLTIFQNVRRDTPQYFFTLAALYMNQGRTGNAVDAIEKFINTDKMKSDSIHDMMTINAIKFLIQQNQTELAGKAVEKKAVNIKSVSILIQLAEFLKNSGMKTSGEKVLGYAIEGADNVKGLVELSTFLFDNGENDKGTDALEQALNSVKTTNDLLLVTETAIKAQKDQIIDQVTRKTELISDLSQRLKFTDIFLEYHRKEEAISVFAEMIKDVRSNTPNKIEQLIFLIDAALNRDFIPQAVNATQRLFLYLGQKKNDFPMNIGMKLESAKELPHKDKITLPQFYGMLNEELEYTDKAEEQYIDSINLSLRHILESYGYDLPDSLNDYYLLGRIWTKKNKNDLIGQLDRVYSIIEEQFIQQQTLALEGNLETLQNKIKQKNKEGKELSDKIQSSERQNANQSRELTVRILSLTATLILFVCIIVGSLILSYQYAKQLTHQKTYGFITKFLEISGWVRVITILGALSGFLAIIFAQFFQILQGIQENTFQPTYQKNISSDQ